MKYQWKESSTCQAQLGLIVKWDIWMIECCQQIETLRWTKSPTITVWISKLFFILITLARSMWSTDFSSSPSQNTHIIDMQRTLSGYNNLVPIAICCCILILVAISRKEIQPILIQIRIRSGRLWGFHCGFSCQFITLLSCLSSQNPHIPREQKRPANTLIMYKACGSNQETDDPFVSRLVFSVGTKKFLWFPSFHFQQQEYQDPVPSSQETDGGEKISK